MEADMRNVLISAGVVFGLVGLGLSTVGGHPWRTAAVLANDSDFIECPVSHQVLRTQLIAADAADTSGLDNHYWAVVVNRQRVVCAVAFSANGLSLDSAPLSSAQLYPWVQPGAPANPLFGLAAGNPVSPEDAYRGPSSRFGTANDPMIGKRVGGTITFGGGLGLYDGTRAIGGLGLSGD